MSMSVSVSVAVAVSRLGCIGWRTKTLRRHADYIMRHRLRQSALSDAQVAHEEEDVI